MDKLFLERCWIVIEIFGDFSREEGPVFLPSLISYSSHNLNTIKERI